MTNHTPGTWTYSKSLISDDRYVVGAKNLIVTYIAARTEKRKGTALANAQLIAAAPELLHGLKIATQYINNDAVVAELEEYIAKAEGRA